jgi:hypothetical protein
MSTTTMTSEPTFLAIQNHHPMDDRISFDEPTHIYTIDGDSTYTSVTTFVHHHFPHFDGEKVIRNLLAPNRIINGRTTINRNKFRAQAFKNILEENKCTEHTASVLLNNTESDEYKREAKKIADEWSQTSTSGTQTHLDIEYFYNKMSVENTTKEYEYFQNFHRDFEKQFPQYRPYRTEWTVFYKELKLAGSIDMVYENTEDGTLMIYDWKRVKEIKYDAFGDECATDPVLADIPNANFWHYSLQLNTYKAILEAEYGKKVTALRLVRLYPTAENYEIIDCQDLQSQVLTLFDNRRKKISE